MGDLFPFFYKYINKLYSRLNVININQLGYKFIQKQWFLWILVYNRIEKTCLPLSLTKHFYLNDTPCVNFLRISERRSCANSNYTQWIFVLRFLFATWMIWSFMTYSISFFIPYFLYCLLQIHVFCLQAWHLHVNLCLLPQSSIWHCLEQ